MEVKEIVNTKAGAKTVQDLSRSSHAQPSGLSSHSQQSKVDSAHDSIDLRHRQQQIPEAREKANLAVSLTNVAAVATEEIAQIVQSIGGIVEQASTERVSDRQLALLESEANELVSAIKDRAQTAVSNGVNPLAGDKIKLEVEEKLGKTLEFILPDSASKGFGLGELKFSSKDLIIATIAKISVAQEQLKELRQAVDQTSVAVKNAVSKLEVALRNNESADTTVADVDEALRLAEETRGGIEKNPEGALKSVGNLNRESADLLE